ncbi:glucose-6-phosphate dehydrogenase [Mycolicibacterium pulveris]|uniref:glucose-6-phosphate dehydrogenase n=1 Tax=Mycolicibacterium pulveris TaxID=36813 RepID=UPI003CF464CD
MIATLLIIGATGDLTSRLLLPALARLRATAVLPNGFRLVGAAFDDWTETEFQTHVRDAVVNGTEDVSDDVASWLAGAATYRRLDVTDADAVRDVVAGAAHSDPVGIYLALPTALVEPALEALTALELPASSRVAVEKPFGDDADSARRLNTLLLRAVGEPGEAAAYRVDHALGMTTLHNLFALRFSNRLLENSWNHEHIERVDVLWDETIALEGRASYYDKAGALRDVMQNHMTQVLCIAAMEPPANSAPGDVHRAKLDVLQNISVVRRSDGTCTARRARYTSGALSDEGGADGSDVPDYAEEAGVDPQRQTETLAEVHLSIDTPRWRNTRFVMRAGKALAEMRKGILVHYRGAEQTLWIGIDGPHDIGLELTGATLGPPTEDQPLRLRGPAPAAALPPYGYVLADFLSGGHAHSVIGEEPVEAWRTYEPVLQDWNDGGTPLETYPAGTSVPITERSD